MKKLTIILSFVIFLVIPTICEADLEKSNSLILLNAQTQEETEAGIKLIEQNGGDVRHVFPPDVLIAYFPEEVAISGRLKNDPVISEIFHQAVDPTTIFSKSEIGIQGVKSWNYLLTEAGKVPPGIEEQEPSPLAGDAFPPINVLGEKDSSKSSVGWGSCYQIGRASVGILFMESNGHDEDWTQEQYDRATGEIVEGFDRSSSYAYEKRISATWFYDIHYSVPTNSEPIQGDHCPRWEWVPPHWEFGWCNDALDYLGYSHGWDGMNEYINAMRSANQTEWGFIIYLVDDENDPDHEFADDYFAYAWLGGPCVVMTYNNDDWGWWNMDEVVDHEKCHVFGVNDEYADACGSDDCTTPYGYLDVDNGNCESCNSNPNMCIMRGRMHETVYCSYTEGQIGWRDLDGNYIPDPLDMGTQHSENLWDVYPGDLVTIYNVSGQLVKVISVSPDNCAIRLYSGRSVALWDATNNEGDAVSYAQYFWKVNGVSRGNLLWYMDTSAPYFTEYSLQNCTLYFRLHDEDTAGGYMTITVFDADWNVVGYVMRHKFLTCRDAPGEPLHEIQVPLDLLGSGSTIKLSCSDGGGNDASSVMIPISITFDTPTLEASLVQESNNHYFHLTWSDDNTCIEGYELQYKNEWTSWTTVSLPAYCDAYNYTPWLGSSVHWFRVRPFIGDLCGSWSNEVTVLNVPNSPTNPHVRLYYKCGWPDQTTKVATEYHHDSYFPPESIITFQDLSENPSDTLYDLAPEPGPDPPPCFPTNRAYVSWGPPENQAEPVDYYMVRLLLYIYGQTAVYWVGPFSAEACTLCLWPNKEYRLCVVAYNLGLHSDEVVNTQIFTTGETIVCYDYSHKGTPPENQESEEPGIRFNLASNQYSLVQNRPNPFNPETEMSYNLPEDCMVKLTIYNMLGQKVRVLVDEHQMAGFKTIRWDGKDDDGNQVASGIYFYRLQASEYVQVRKMILLR